MTEQRYDVVYHQHHTTIEPHFCREWDGSGGCYGTNPNHGFTLEEACEQVAQYYEEEAKRWREKTHADVVYYTQGTIQGYEDEY